MRLRVSRPQCDELILSQLNTGYALARSILEDYEKKRAAGSFDPASDMPEYRKQLNVWLNITHESLVSIFPTPLEANLFVQRFSVNAVDYIGMSSEIGNLIMARIPEYIDRLHRILERHAPRYGDLPLKERLFVEDVDSFAKVRDVNPALVRHLLSAGRIELSEDAIQLSLESILEVPLHRRDWGGEVNDLYTANLVLNGRRRATAFLLKGAGKRAKELQIADCGKNGDQLLRLFHSPADLFVVQYVGPVSDAVISDAHGKTMQKRAQGSAANFLVIDGQDTARLLLAYGKLPHPSAG